MEWIKHRLIVDSLGFTKTEICTRPDDLAREKVKLVAVFIGVRREIARKVIIVVSLHDTTTSYRSRISAKKGKC